MMVVKKRMILIVFWVFQALYQGGVCGGVRQRIKPRFRPSYFFEMPIFAEK